jgi:ubiquitin-like protein Nedd8
MLITIKTLSGRKLSLDFEPTQKVEEIKNALQEKEGIPVQQIRLIYSGKILKDELTIQEANINPGTTLMMMMHLKGGF